MSILLVLSVSIRLLGIEPNLNGSGLNLGSLLSFAAVMGFGGSLISLALSKCTVKRAICVRVIETPVNPSWCWLLDTVRRYAWRLGAVAEILGLDGQHSPADEEGSRYRQGLCLRTRPGAHQGCLSPLLASGWVVSISNRLAANCSTVCSENWPDR